MHKHKHLHKHKVKQSMHMQIDRMGGCSWNQEQAARCSWLLLPSKTWQAVQGHTWTEDSRSNRPAADVVHSS